MSLRDDLRKLTVGSKSEYRTTEIDYRGQKVVFKQPSLKLRKEILNRSVVDKEIDGVSVQVWSVIYLTQDAEGNRLFDDADYESFMEKPAGGFVDTFSEHAMALLGNDEAEEPVKV